LIAYSVWLWRNKSRMAAKFRWAIYLVSGFALVVAWGTTIALISDRYAARLLPALACRFEIPRLAEIAIPRLEQYVAHDGSRDLKALRNLANCYSQAKRDTDEIETLDKLLSNPSSLSVLGPREYGLLSAEAALGLLGTDYLGPSQPDKAVHYLRAARQYLGSTPATLTLLAYAISQEDRNKLSAHERQEIAELFAEAKKLMQAFPDPEAVRNYHYFYGQSLVSMGEPDDASRELNAALEGEQRSERRDEIFYFQGLNELFNRNDLNAASNWWTQMKGRERLVETLSGTVLGLYFEADRVQGDASLRMKLLDQAQQLLGVAAQTVKKERRYPAKFLLAAGFVAIGREHYQEAEYQFGEFVKQQPFDATGYYWLGRAHISAKAYKEAQIALAEAVELDPTNADAKYYLGVSLTQINEWDKARSVLSEAVGQQPDNPSFLLLFLDVSAVLAEREKDLEVRERLFSETLKLAERTISAAEKAHEPETAKLAHRSRADILNGLADAYRQRGEALTAASDYIDRALRDFPEDPVYLGTKAQILIKLAERTAASAEREENLRQAEELLNSASNQKTNSELAAELWVDRGNIEQLRGHDDAANHCFLKALDLDPTNVDAKRLAK
jgi:tetratricopeptide (TPR) repeat protein